MVTFLTALCAHLDLHPAGTSLFDVLFCLIMNIIPAKQLSDALVLEILMKRVVNTEPEEDLDELCSMEHVLESFDDDERKSLEPEIKSAKNTQSEWKTIRNAVGNWRVSLAPPP